MTALDHCSTIALGSAGHNAANVLLMESGLAKVCTYDSATSTITSKWPVEIFSGGEQLLWDALILFAAGEHVTDENYETERAKGKLDAGNHAALAKANALVTE